MFSTDTYFLISEYLSSSNDLKNLLLIDKESYSVRKKKKLKKKCQEMNSFWKNKYKRTLDEMKKTEKSKKQKKISDSHLNLYKNNETIYSSVQWRNSFKGITVKRKIFNLEMKMKDNMFQKDPVDFWTEILDELNKFDDLCFTRKMLNSPRSLLDFFFISLFEFGDFQNLNHIIRKFDKINALPIPRKFDSKKILILFEKIYEKMNLKINFVNSSKFSPLCYLIWLNDFEFFQQILKITKFNGKFTNAEKKNLFYGPLSLKFIKFVLQDDYSFTALDCKNMIFHSNSDVVKEFASEIEKKFSQIEFGNHYRENLGLKQKRSKIIMSNIETYLKNGKKFPTYPNGNSVDKFYKNFICRYRKEKEFIKILVDLDLCNGQNDENFFYCACHIKKVLELFLDCGYDITKTMTLHELILYTSNISYLKVKHMDIFFKLGFKIDDKIGENQKKLLEIFNENSSNYYYGDELIEYLKSFVSK